MNKYYYIEESSSIYFEKNGKVVYIDTEDLKRIYSSTLAPEDLNNLKGCSIFPITIIHADSLEEALVQYQVLYN